MTAKFTLLITLIMLSGLGINAMGYEQKIDVFHELQADEYGGLYMEGNIIHVNIVTGKENLVPRIDRPDIVYHEVDYTLADLEKLKRELQPLMGEFSIQELGIDTKLNRLSITLYKADDDDRQRFDQWLNERGAGSMCVVTETEYEVVLQ